MQGVTSVIRPIRDDDDLDDLHDGDYEWAGAELARRFAATDEPSMLAFHVAEQDGRLLGYLDGVLPPDDNPTRSGFASLWVRPDARGQGIGSALLETLLPIATARGVRRLTTHVDSKDEASRRFVAAHGATTGRTHLESKLELTGDLPLLPPPAGVSLDSVDSDAEEVEWRAAYEAHSRLLRDAPDWTTNPVTMPYAIFRILIANAWQLCLAKTDDGAIVGLTCVFPKNERERWVNTILTAVNREWRGQGLATALKTAHAVKLRDAGWRAIITQNLEDNDHILAANRRLGFVPSNTMMDVIYEFPEQFLAEEH